MNVTTVSVKVMRSHDYCHFEVALSADLTPDEPAYVATDELRKIAARLADKAVEQYKCKKEALQIEGDWETRDLRDKAKEIATIAEADRTPEQMATIKEYGDRCHRANYDYEDGGESPDPDVFP